MGCCSIYFLHVRGSWDTGVSPMSSLSTTPLCSGSRSHLDLPHWKVNRTLVSGECLGKCVQGAPSGTLAASYELHVLLMKYSKSA